MNLSALTTALHKWADKHGGQFPDAMLCNATQQHEWAKEAETRFGLIYDASVIGNPSSFKGVTILPLLTPDDDRVLFACTPSD